MPLEEIRVETWAEYEEVVQQLYRDVEKQKDIASNPDILLPGAPLPNPNTPLFRGQANAGWSLQSTLERETGNNTIRVSNYYNTLDRIVAAVNSLTGKSFHIDEKYIIDQTSFTRRLYHFLPLLEFVVYTRQFGFPSPLLDWSQSPYVAAFFAYYSSQKDDVAVYAFVEGYHQGIRIWGNGDKVQVSVGPYIETTERHFTQRSQYTYCISEIDNDWFFVDANESFTTSKNDLIKKIILPIAMKEHALAQLDRMNVNAFSLFGTEEALLSDLFFREKHHL